MLDPTGHLDHSQHEQVNTKLLSLLSDTCRPTNFKLSSEWAFSNSTNCPNGSEFSWRREPSCFRRVPKHYHHHTSNVRPQFRVDKSRWSGGRGLPFGAHLIWIWKLQPNTTTTTYTFMTQDHTNKQNKILEPACCSGFLFFLTFVFSSLSLSLSLHLHQLISSSNAYRLLSGSFVSRSLRALLLARRCIFFLVILIYYLTFNFFLSFLTTLTTQTLMI